MALKKTVLALIVAASSAISCSALAAWTTGDVDQSVNFGGDIDVNAYVQKWQWMVGTGFDSYSNLANEMTQTDAGYKLSITNHGNNPILVGETKVAFATPTENAGAMPQIKFTDTDGNQINIKYTDANHDGKVYFELPVTADSQKIGKVRINARLAADEGVGDNSSSTGQLFSVEATTTDNAMRIFTGGMTDYANPIITDGSAAASLVSQFGGLSETDLLNQVKLVNKNINSLESQTHSQREDMNYDDGTVVAASYALGIADGDTLDLTLTQQVTKHTHWTAPLHITVSYQ